TSGVDLLHGCQALRVTEVAAQREPAGRTVIQAGVIEISDRALAGCAAAGVTECPRLEYAAAGGPEVVGVCGAQRVEFAGDGDLGMRAQDHDAVAVVGVHHIKERKFGVWARCGQELEERLVAIVAGFAVSGAPGETAPQPGLEFCRRLGLPSGFEIK